MFDFCYLFQDSISKKAFFKKYFEKAILHLKRNDKNYYNELLNIEDYDSIITSFPLDKNNIRLSRDGDILPINNVLSNNSNFEYISNEKIIDEYLNGTTIVLEKFQRYKYEANLLCKQIQHEFNCAVNINSYLTPPNSHGFGFHFDKHSVIILQIHGSKKWFVDDKPYEKFPIHGITYTDLSDYKSETMKEIVLNAGDLLYIPRGCVHKAVCQDTNSIHFSVGLHPLILKNYLIDRLNKVTEDNEQMRYSLTLNNSNIESLFESFNSFKQAVLDKTNKDTLSAEIKKHVINSSINSLQKNRFTNIISLSDINLNTIVEFNKGVYPYIESDTDNNYILVMFNSKKLRLPAVIRKDIETLNSKKKVRQLFKMFESNARIEIAKILLSHGLLKISYE